MSREAILDTVLMTAGRITFVGIWFLAVLLVYRGLGDGADGLAQAGLFAIAIASAKVASGFLSDPLDLALMRRAPALLRAEPAKAFEIFRAAIGLRLGAALTLAAIGALFASPIATGLLGRPDAAGVVRWIAAAIVADAAFRAILVIFQAGERFRRFVLLEALVQAGRAGAILALWATGSMQVERVLAAYAAVPLAVACLGFAMLRGGLFESLRMRWSHVLDLVHYLKWMVPAMVLGAVNERLDVFLVYSFEGAGAAGLYGFVLTLALIPDIVSGCLAGILQPRIVRLHAAGDYGETMRRFLIVSLPLCGVAFLVALTLAEPVISLVLGSRYLPAMPAFYWLLAGTLFWLAVTPLPANLLTLLAPRRIVLFTLAQSAIVVLGGLLLLPSHGLVGMAQAVFAMRVAISLAFVMVARSMTASVASAAALELSGPVRP